MQAVNSFKHHHPSYQFQIFLQQNNLIMSLVSQPSSKLWKETYTYSQLPASLTVSVHDLKQVFLLFEEQDNFNVKQSTGLVTVVVKSIVKNKVVENSVSFQLKHTPPKVQQPDKFTIEMMQQLKNLKENVQVLQLRMDEVEKNEKVSAQVFSQEEELERNHSEVMSYSEYQERGIKRLDERLEKAEEDIRSIKEFLKVKEQLPSEIKSVKMEQPSELNLSKSALIRAIRKWVMPEYSFQQMKAFQVPCYLYEELNNLTCLGMGKLSRGRWNQLKVLHLSKNKIGDQGIIYMQSFPNVEKLYLTDCGITSSGMETLSQFNLPLTTLNLDSNPIKNEGLEYLQAFKNIVHLNLYNTKINAHGIVRLSQMPLNSLWFLNLRANEIGEGKAVIEKWKHRKKGVRIYY